MRNGWVFLVCGLLIGACNVNWNPWKITTATVLDVRTLRGSKTILACTVLLDIDGSQWLVSAPTWARSECAGWRVGDRISVARHHTGSHVQWVESGVHYQSGR